MTTETAPEVDRDLLVCQDARVLTEEVDGEAVLYHEEHGRIHVLDPISTVVWRMLVSPVKLGHVIDALAEIADADEATVERDVLALTRELAELGVLDRVPSVPHENGEPHRRETPPRTRA